MNIKTIIIILISGVFISACSEFEDFNANPNEPTIVSSDVLLPNSTRSSVNTAVDASFLVGNNAAQLTAKTLRLEVDAYDWNAFPSYWQDWYESLTDLTSIDSIASDNGNDQMLGASIVLRSWIFQNLTNAYGDVPYFEATQGRQENFTPVYDRQEDIYMDLLSQLERAVGLLNSGGNLDGDILLDGDPEKWIKFANSLRLRLLLYASGQMDVRTEFKQIVENGVLLESNEDNVELQYTGSFPNEFPLIPLKIGDADAVAISETSLSTMKQYADPRMNRYTRPNSDVFEMYEEETIIVEYNEDSSEVERDTIINYIGAINGQGPACSKAGASRLGPSYYNYPSLTQASNLGLENANGIIMSYAEVEFVLAEAAAKGWITGSPEEHYRKGIQASMQYHNVNFEHFGYSDFDDYYQNSGVAYSTSVDIWEQKWLALFFHGLEPYFELRRWITEGDNGFESLPFIDPSCGNVNGDILPNRFLYPGEEQSLNAANYQEALDRIGGSNDQNAPMWITQ